MIEALTWSGLPRSAGGGVGACVEWPVHIPLPDVAGQMLPIGGQDYRVIRVVRLYRDKGGRKPSSRIAFVVSEDGGQSGARA